MADGFIDENIQKAIAVANLSDLQYFVDPYSGVGCVNGSSGGVASYGYGDNFRVTNKTPCIGSYISESLSILGVSCYMPKATTTPTKFELREGMFCKFEKGMGSDDYSLTAQYDARYSSDEMHLFLTPNTLVKLYDAGIKSPTIAAFVEGIRAQGVELSGGANQQQQQQAQER